MNPDELIKAVPTIAKGAGALAAAIPFTAIVKRMLGPAADEVAEQLRTEIRVYRYGRTLKLLEKAERMAQEAGYTPNAVPIKLLFPLLEGASFEEDEDLHTMWAALLANAASENPDAVRPGFIATLREMAPDEAKLLAWIHDNSQGWSPFTAGLKFVEGQVVLGFTSQEEAHRSPHMDKRMALCLDALEAQQVIRRVYWHPTSGFDESRMLGRQPVNYSLTITERGRAFMEACRPPKPKA